MPTMRASAAIRPQTRECAVSEPRLQGLRSGPGFLRGCDCLLRLRPGLPLRHVAAASAYSPVLVSRMADLPQSQDAAGKFRAARPNLLEQRRSAALHRAPFEGPLDGTLVPGVGMPDRCGSHLPAVVWMDTLRDCDRQPADLSCLRVWHPRGQLPLGQHNGAAGFQHCLLYTSPSPRDRTRSRMT